MVTNRADAVRLGDGDIAHIIKGGTQHPLTRQPLAEGQLLLLLREMAPPEVAPRLLGTEGMEFVYANGDGRFLTRVMREGGLLRAEVTQAPTAVGNGNGHSAHAHESNGHAAEVSVDVTPESALAAAPIRAATPSHGARLIVEPSHAQGGAAARREIEALLAQLASESGSDLHLRVGEPPIMRIHGELKRVENREILTPSLLEAMLTSVMPPQNFREFGETCDTDFAHEIAGVARFRGNVFRDHHGPGGVFRVIPGTVATVEDLNITPEVQNLCALTKGLVLVTGPTGSGKSTTLGALVDLVNRTRDDHLITIEDPIEFVHKNKRCIITQRQVGLHTGSFKAALRAALREDPDIVLVGELRDLETISIALVTGETGHLVFGTLHTTTAAGTIDRIIDQFPADRQPQVRVMLADTLKGVISQTLCKRIGGGRIAAREILLTVPAVSNLIREGKPFLIPSVMQTSRKLGMILLGDVLIDLVDQGLVSPHEAFLKATDKPAFVAMLKNRGFETSFA
jgi:twitching motility protein PilT